MNTEEEADKIAEAFPTVVVEWNAGDNDIRCTYGPFDGHNTAIEFINNIDDTRFEESRFTVEACVPTPA